MTSTAPDPTTPTPPAEPAAEPTADAADASAEPSEDDGRGGNPEAARYRTRLRVTEAELTTARTRLETLQRAEVERLAGDVLAQGSDVFTVAGIALDEVLTPEGTVDADLVRMAVAQLVATRPGLHKGAKQVAPDVGQGNRGAAGASSGRSWSDIIARVR
jgi:hypothetical protein